MELNEAVQDELTDRFAAYFKDSPDYRFIAWDLETNGLKGTSVLSLSAIKCRVKPDKGIKIEGVMTHYYYPEDETYNEGALRVNGLTKEVVDGYRQGFSYPPYFSEDLNNFAEFCGDIEHCLTHNGIEFDSTFIPRDSLILKNHFDTKVLLEPVMKMPATDKMIAAGQGNQFKSPKLSEAASWVGITLDETKLHGSAYDTLLTVKIFEFLLKQSMFRPAVL